MTSESIIILANGTFPKAKYLLDILDAATQIICCDGAANKLIQSGREPSVIIGDLDSVSQDHKEKYMDIMIHVDDQNTNDLTKAVNWCCSNKIEEIIIMGATGEREDHTIANVSLLTEYHKIIKVKMLTDNGVFIPISKTTSFKAIPGQQVSIFSMNPTILICSEGLKYPLQNIALKNWWMGTLNESTSTKFKIIIDEEARVVVYSINLSAI